MRPDDAPRPITGPRAFVGWMNAACVLLLVAHGVEKVDRAAAQTTGGGANALRAAVTTTGNALRTGAAGTATPTRDPFRPNFGTPSGSSGVRPAELGTTPSVAAPATSLPATTSLANPGAGRTLPAGGPVAPGPVQRTSTYEESTARSGSTARLRIGGTPSAAAEPGARLEIRKPAATHLPPATMIPPSTPSPNAYLESPSSSLGVPTSATPRIVPLDAPAAGATPANMPTAPPNTITPTVTTPNVAPATPGTTGRSFEPGTVVVGDDGSLSDAPADSPSRQSSPVAAPQAFGPTQPAAMPQPAAPTTLPAGVMATQPSTAPATALTLEPVDFNGVLLGTSTADEVRAAWGEPKQQAVQDGVLKMSFDLPPFTGVEVLFLDGRASSIIVDLGEFYPVADVAQELGLEGMPSVAIEDERGRALGVVYPERGVAFRFDGDGAQGLVAQIGLDKIDARPFVLRAERRLTTDYRGALDDAATALRLDPKQSRALYVRAVVLEKIGCRREALEAVESALKLEEKNLEYLLVRAKLLGAAGMFDAALNDDKAVIEGAAAAVHLQARAWCLRGDLLADGPSRDYAAAVDAHTRAVRLAEPSANDERPAVRRMAREVLVDAHLAIALDVAWGNWQRKETVVPLWLSRGEKFAADAVRQGDLPPDVMLRVYARALEANVGLQGALDSKDQAEGLQATAETLAEACADELRLRHIRYEAGMGLYDALQALHARGEIDAAVRCGQAAVELVQAGREGRDEGPTDAYRYGRLYFRVGSLYAVHRGDHASAVEWFDRAAPLLERPLPEAAAADRGRQGETLVSMGISYWAVGKHERGLQLTETGKSYMQAAVDDGLLSERALSVAFTNLATMHRQNGDANQSARYAEMATRVEASGDGVLRR